MFESVGPKKLSNKKCKFRINLSYAWCGKINVGNLNL